jgi:hypothetical protein
MSDIKNNFFLYIQKTINDFDPKNLILTKEYYEFSFYCLIFWIFTYLFIHFCVPMKFSKKKDLYDSKTRIVSIIHASIIFLMAVYDAIYHQREVCGDTNTSFQNYMMMFSCSYFIYDLFACLILGCSDNEMVAHHIVCILGYQASIGYNSSANEIIRALIVTEVTCPIMHVRMIFKNYGLKHTKSHLLMDYIYMVLYLIARIGYGHRVIIFTVYCWDNLLIVKIAGSFLFIQSSLFAKRMVKLLSHKFAEQKERNAKKVKLFWFEHNKQIEDLDYYQKQLKKSSYIP